MFSMFKHAAVAAAVTIFLVPTSDFTKTAHAEMPATLKGFGAVSTKSTFAMTGLLGSSVTEMKSRSESQQIGEKPYVAAAKRDADAAKRRAEFAEKQAAAYEKLMANMSDTQKGFFKERHEALLEKAREATVEANKLAAKAGVAGRAGSAVAGNARYAAIIARYAAANGVPLNLATAVVRVESNFRANARGAAGEIGLMQIKPATARLMGYSGSVKGLYDPETNIKWGMKYLGKAHQLGGGSVCGTILKYNAGHGARRMNPISANYCKKVQRYI